MRVNYYFLLPRVTEERYSVFQVYEVGTRDPIPCPYGGDRARCGILYKPGMRCRISEKASDVILASAKNQKILPVYESK